MNVAEKQMDKEEYLKGMKSTSNIFTAIAFLCARPYDHELAENTYDVRTYFKAAGVNSKHNDDIEYSALTILFNEEELCTLTRSELFGFADFLGNIGGLLAKLFKKLIKLTPLQLIKLRSITVAPMFISDWRTMYY